MAGAPSLEASRLPDTEMPETPVRHSWSPAALTLAAILGLGILTGRRVKDASDFDTGGNAAGPVLYGRHDTRDPGGRLVHHRDGPVGLPLRPGPPGGFTLGCGLGVPLAGGPQRTPALRPGSGTIGEIIGREYGGTAGVVTSVSRVRGFVLNIAAQILAANALLETVFGLPGGSGRGPRRDPHGRIRGVRGYPPVPASWGSSRWS
ncbi:MAG: hypothetical protein M0C28_30290 [Candidatus Moduliflexus flocculans]|nr:hypothetical protein [Candidatus Moduliflexus flocculans]